MAKLKDNHTHTWGKTDWLKKTSFPGTENQRDVPQLALPFSSFDLGGLLPPLLSVHSKSRKEGIIFLWMQHGWTTTENHKTEIRSLSCVFGKPWHCLFAILTPLFPAAAPLVWMELHTQKHEFRLHFFLCVPTREMSNCGFWSTRTLLYFPLSSICPSSQAWHLNFPW